MRVFKLLLSLPGFDTSTTHPLSIIRIKMKIKEAIIGIIRPHIANIR